MQESEFMKRKQLPSGCRRARRFPAVIKCALAYALFLSIATCGIGGEPMPDIPPDVEILEAAEEGTIGPPADASTTPADAGTTAAEEVEVLPPEPEEVAWEERREQFIDWRDGVENGIGAIDIDTMIRTFCDDILGGEHYAIAPTAAGKLKQTISVYAGDIAGWSREQKEALFDSLLFVNGLKRRKIGELWYIELMAVNGPIMPEAGIYNADDPLLPPGQTPVIGVFDFKHIHPNEAQGLLQRLTNGATAQFFLPPRSNFLLVIDAAANIRQMEQFVAMIDVDPTLQKHYLIRNASAQDVATELSAIYGNQPNATGQPIRFVAVDRVNIVVANNATLKDIPEIDRWVQTLDVTDRFERMVTKVYRMRVEDATAVAALLNQLYGRLQAIDAKRNAGKKNVEGPARPGEFSGEAIILADKNTNSILVHTSESNHKIIDQTLQELDRPRKQVLIEVVVAEVTLDAQTELGIEWTLRQEARNKGQQHTVGSNTGLGSLGVAQDWGKTTSGLNYLVTGTDKFMAMLHAAQNDSRLTVLSSPSVLTAENVEATISFGREVPVEQQTINNNILTTAYQYKDAKIELKVKPKINDNRVVSLDVQQVIRQVSEGSSDTAPTFLSREITTSLEVADGQTLILGGLIDRTDTEGRVGVPILSDIPLVGRAFRNDKRIHRGSELLMILTPRVVDSRCEADGLTNYMQDKVLNSLSRENIRDTFELPPIEERRSWWQRKRDKKTPPAAHVAPSLECETCNP